MGETKKVKALTLTLGGAPLEWHVIEGVGFVHPEIPSPVGGENEVSVQVAEKVAKGNTRVEIVQITEAEATAARKQRTVAANKGIAAVREARRRAPRATDKAKVQTEIAAVTAGKGE